MQFGLNIDGIAFWILQTKAVTDNVEERNGRRQTIAN